MFGLNPVMRRGVCASVFTFALPVFAVDDRTETAETIVVTASATEQNLNDVLKDIPGVQLTNEGDNRKGASIPGLSSSYTGCR